MSESPLQLRPLDAWIRHGLALTGRRFEYWLIAKGLEALFITALGTTLLTFVIVPCIATLFGGLVSNLLHELSFVGWLRPFLDHLLIGSLPAAACFGLATFGYFAAAQVISTLANGFVTAGFEHASAAESRWEPPLAQTAAHLAHAFGLSLVLSFIVVGAAALCFAPALLLMPTLVMAWYICVIEGRTIHESLALSWERSRGHRLGIFSRFAFFGVVMFTLFLGLNFAATLPLLGVLALPLLLGFQLLLPIVALAFGYSIYRDLRPADGTVETPLCPLPLLYGLCGLGLAVTFIALPLLLWKGSSLFAGWLGPIPW
ncbi:MAG: hypothetical protein HY696_01305 [Deltaproteobacteria bacterium]|nr:hypothetical protein [Deltaproteobacteria bacterium]